MRLPALGLVLLLATSVSLAQPVAPPDPGVAASTCSYAECALRVERGMWGSWGGEIVRGPVDEAEVVGRIGLFRSELGDLTAGVPPAYALATRHDRLRRRSALLVASGVVLAALAGPLGAEGEQGLAIASSLGGLGLLFAGSGTALAADRAQARAVWEYNRSLAE